MQCFIDIGFHWHCFWRSLFSDIFCTVLLKWFHLRHLEIYITLQVVPDSPLFACTGCNTNDSVIVVSGDCCRAGGFQEVGRRCGVLNTLLSHEVTGWHATRRTGRGCRLPHGENWDAGEDGVVPSAELSQNSGKVQWRWFCLYHRSAECLWVLVTYCHWGYVSVWFCLCLKSETLQLDGNLAEPRKSWWTWKGSVCHRRNRRSGTVGERKSKGVGNWLTQVCVENGQWCMGSCTVWLASAWCIDVLLDMCFKLTSRLSRVSLPAVFCRAAVGTEFLCPYPPYTHTHGPGIPYTHDRPANYRRQCN